MRCCELHSAREIESRLPQGFETHFAERGVRLSGGRRQRVAIARQFLILDEASSALDVETERAVVEAIGSLAERKTRLVIAQGASTLAHAYTAPSARGLSGKNRAR